MSMFHPIVPAAAAATHASPPSEVVRHGAKALVSSSDRVLLVKEQHDDETVFWTLPGGGVRDSERLVDGLQRELTEELRCDAVVGDAVSEFWYAHLSSAGTLSRYTVFSCAAVSNIEPVATEGILEAEWFTPDDLPASTLPQIRCLLRQRGSKMAVPNAPEAGRQRR